MTSTASLTIRPARAADEPALVRLALLDSQRPLVGERLVAEESGTIRAALALDSDRVVADPFAPTADVVDLLRRHASRSAAPIRPARPARRRHVPAFR